VARSIIETIFITLRDSLGDYGVTYDVKPVLRGCFTTRRSSRSLSDFPFRTSSRSRVTRAASRSEAAARLDSDSARVRLHINFRRRNALETREIHAFVPSHPFRPSPPSLSPESGQRFRDLARALTRALAFRRVLGKLRAEGPLLLPPPRHPRELDASRR